MISSGRSRAALTIAATAMLVAAAPASGGCRVFTKTEDCSADSDCGREQRCHPEGHYCERLTEIHVGVIAARTGLLKPVAENFVLAAQLAADVVNDAGGVLGAKLVLDVLDDEDDANLSEAHAKTLVARNVVGVIGPMRSSQVLKAQAVTYPAKLLQLSPLGGADALAASQPAKDRYLFQTITSIRRGSSAAVVRYVSKPVDDPPRPEPACTKMAVLHTDDVTGNEYGKAIAALLAKQGGCVTLDVSFPPVSETPEQVRPHVQKLIAAKPECAALITMGKTGAAILREFKEQAAKDTSKDWSKFPFYGTTTLHNAGFLEAAKDVAEGFMGADVDPAPQTAEFDEYRAIFRERRGSEPPPLTANVFDAVVLLALSISRAGSAHDRVAIRDAIYEVSRTGDRVAAFGPADVAAALKSARRGVRINYQGASGPVDVDDTGVVDEPTIIWSVKGGKFVEPVVRYTDAQMHAMDDPLKTGRTCP